MTTPPSGVPQAGGSADNVVLVVEDDPQVRQSVQWSLEDEGLTVEIAADGREALFKASRLQPALVVLDHGLPDRNGAEVAAELRQRCGDHLPILLFTGDGQAKEKAAAAGAFAYLHKPFDMDRLVKLVHDSLSGRSQD
jgi:DNA-binding response OmpR family regulator